jgi:hypothetical protein
MKIWDPKPLGTLWATPGLLRNSFSFYLLSEVWFLRTDTYLKFTPLCIHFGLVGTDAERGMVPAGDFKSGYMTARRACLAI